MREYAMPLLLLIFLCTSIGGSVFSRFLEIENAGKEELANFPTIHKEKGKPVDVMTVNKGDLTLSVLVTGVVLNKSTLEVFIEGKSFKGIGKRAQFHGLEEFDKINGFVATIPKQRDLQTGLYRLTLKSDNKLPPKGSLVPLEIDIKSFEDRVILPVASITPRKGKLLVWKVEDQQANKKLVKIGRYNKKFVEILEGVNEGDIIVTKGASLLKTGDKIRIVKN